jgi:hypothetical protein
MALAGMQSQAIGAHPSNDFDLTWPSIRAARRKADD